MPRKVVIRQQQKGSGAIFQLEKMIKDDFNTIWKSHMNSLEKLAAKIENDAKELVPIYDHSEQIRKEDGTVYTWIDPKVNSGALQESISVKVSESRRYPGIIAKASARNKGKHWDYALIQEENIYFEHPEHITGGLNESGQIGQARYLSQPFYDYLEQYLYKFGSNLSASNELERYLDEFYEEGNY